MEVELDNVREIAEIVILLFGVGIPKINKEQPIVSQENGSL